MVCLPFPGCNVEPGSGVQLPKLTSIGDECRPDNANSDGSRNILCDTNNASLPGIMSERAGTSDLDLP